jgi:hypothetical protein
LALLNRGDWACVLHEGDTLATICAELEARLSDLELTRQAAHIKALAVRDCRAAAHSWGELALALRADPSRF